VARGRARTPALNLGQGRLQRSRQPLRETGCCRAMGTQVPEKVQEGASASGEPTALQLRRHFVQSMVPMVGFGFMDNTVMIHAGNAIDLTLGVTLGLSTLAAAACGQICSDVAGVTFGGAIESAALRLGLPSPGFTEEQRRDPDIKRLHILGSVVGVICGCSLGLVNLLLIDASEAKEFKLSAAGSDGSDFSVSITNQERDECTAICIEGPATKGLMASVVTALSSENCTLAELGHNDSVPLGAFKSRKFYVKRTGGQLDDDELESIARAVMLACKQPMRFSAMTKENDTLRRENQELHDRLEKLEEKLERRHISIKKSERRERVATSD